MRYLLDTHALAWWLLDDVKLKSSAHEAIADPQNEIIVSAASAFEVATKLRLGKWPEMEALARNFETLVIAERFSLLPVTPAHALLAGTMAGEHKDPFDRILAAQAKLERLTIVSADGALDVFGVARLW